MVTKLQSFFRSCGRKKRLFITCRLNSGEGIMVLTLIEDTKLMKNLLPKEWCFRLKLSAIAACPCLGSTENLVESIVLRPSSLKWNDEKWYKVIKGYNILYGFNLCTFCCKLLVKFIIYQSLTVEWKNITVLSALSGSSQKDSISKCVENSCHVIVVLSELLPFELFAFEDLKLSLLGYASFIEFAYS